MKSACVSKHFEFYLVFAFLIFFLIIFPSTASAEGLVGRVIAVTDGDTLKLLVNERDVYKIRLGEIDAPESGQPYGRASKRMLSDLAFKKTVMVRVTDIDRYGRSVGVIRHGSTNINAEMVKRGGAWAYRRYLSDQRYLVWEAEARRARVGLWALQPDQVMAPWEWRDARRSRASSSTPAGLVQGRRTSLAPLSLTVSPLACGTKTKCREMNSCDQARHYLRACGVSRLDGDGDGVPCEKLCG